MAHEQHLAILRQGSDAWNAWRWQQIHDALFREPADLTGADIAGAKLSGAQLSGDDLSNANLTGADLTRSDLTGAKLLCADLSKAVLFRANLFEARLAGAKFSGAHLSEALFARADLTKADLTGADLTWANFSGANMSRANLTGANLHGANLSKANLSKAILFKTKLTRAQLVRTNLTGADISACRVYGVSAWELKLSGAKQKDLVITPDFEPEITVDNLEVAQFIYILLNNERVRHVIDTITSKVVLILGRFTEERKAVLDALREELRKRDYMPVLFDFDKPGSRSTVETVSTLAHMARFVIADLTDAKSVLQELQAVVPTNPSVPVQPLILATQDEPGMFDFLRLFPWVLEPYRYPDPMGLLAALTDRVIAPAELTLARGVPEPL
jgi:uncharacterized protein YjbI with pentapeptide repeats